jgi:hypothetical protein
LILIWSNTGEWGGVDVLIMRFADFLRARDIPFVIAEPAGSRLRQELHWADFIAVDEARRLDGKISHVLLPTVAKLRDMELPWGCFANSKTLAWNVHPNATLTAFVPLASALTSRFGYPAVRPLLRVVREHERLVSSLFTSLADGGGLAIMDAANRRALAFFYPELPLESALMVPVPAPLSPLERAPRLEGPLSVAYLGRIDDFKWSALKPFVEHNLAAVARKRPIRFTAISEGANLLLLAGACARAGVELRVQGYLPNLEARRFVRANSQLAVAMGTAALDLAGAGHPCVIIDPALKPNYAPQKFFRFVHEAEGHTLGEYRDFPDYVPGLRSFEEVVELVESQDLTSAARSYVGQQHDPDRCFEALHRGLMQSRITMSEIADKAVAIERSVRRIGRSYHWARQLFRGRS